MRICLVWPKSTFLEDPMVYPPLGLWYLWSLLEQMGYAVAYRDMSEDVLPLEDYDIYLVSATSPQISEVKRIGKVLGEHGKRAILGGSHAMTHDGQECRQYGYEVVVKGEVDSIEALREVLEAPAGTCLELPRPPTLDHIGLPCRKAAWRYRAMIEDEFGVKHRATTMLTSRGCPMRCAFCETVGVWGRTVRWVPYETVKREIEEVVGLGFTAIQFYDDIFPLNKARTLKMMDVLGHYHRSQGLIWRCFLRTDVLEKQGGFDYLKQMHAAGLREVLVGVESGSNRIKDNVHKGTTIEQDTRALQWCQQLGVRFKASVVIGLPGETMETLEATRRWIIEKRPDRVELCGFIPLPGTPLVTSVTGGLREYDIYWDQNEVTENYWYVGGGRERTVGKMLVGTSTLTPEQIAAFRQKLIQEIRDIPAAVYHETSANAQQLEFR